YALDVELSDWPNRFTRTRFEGHALVDRPDGLFILSGDSVAELLSELDQLAEIGDAAPKAVARSLWQSRRHRVRGKLGLAFVAESPDEFRQLIEAARDHLRNYPDKPVADRIYYSPALLIGDVAFVYPGSGNHFAGMGRELGAAFPHVLWRQMGENELLASQYHADEVWSGQSLDQLT